MDGPALAHYTTRNQDSFKAGASESESQLGILEQIKKYSPEQANDILEKIKKISPMSESQLGILE